MRLEERLHTKGNEIRIKIISFGITKDAGLRLRKYQLSMIYLHCNKCTQIIQG